MQNDILKQVRLTEKELRAIQQVFSALFLPNDHLWLFGSRANKDKKGGDIDLYIETNLDDFDDTMDKENKLVLNLWERIGEQKIDVIINMLIEGKQLPIYAIAKDTGVKLV